MDDKKTRSKSSITKREFLAVSGSLSLSLAASNLFSCEAFHKSKLKDKPNILIIVSDQLAQKAVGAYGNSDVQTPNIDSIAANGVRFSSTYSNYPLCQPVRASFWTGRLPHETGVVSNGKNFPVPEIPESMPTLGAIFASAGYETVHFGKKHDTGAKRNQLSYVCGFCNAAV